VSHGQDKAIHEKVDKLVEEHAAHAVKEKLSDMSHSK
jgi:hypothetical protein